MDKHLHIADERDPLNSVLLDVWITSSELKYPARYKRYTFRPAA